MIGPYVYTVCSLYTKYFYLLLLLLLHNGYASLVTTVQPVRSISYSPYVWFKFDYCLKSEHFCPVKGEVVWCYDTLEFRFPNLFSYSFPTTSFSFEEGFSMPVCFAS
jgi:hypothetical protein